VKLGWLAKRSIRVRDFLGKPRTRIGTFVILAFGAGSAVVAGLRAAGSGWPESVTAASTVVLVFVTALYVYETHNIASQPTQTLQLQGTSQLALMLIEVGRNLAFIESRLPLSTDHVPDASLWEAGQRLNGSIELLYAVGPLALDLKVEVLVTAKVCGDLASSLAVLSAAFGSVPQRIWPEVAEVWRQARRSLERLRIEHPEMPDWETALANADTQRAHQSWKDLEVLVQRYLHPGLEDRLASNDENSER